MQQQELTRLVDSSCECRRLGSLMVTILLNGIRRKERCGLQSSGKTAEQVRDHRETFTTGIAASVLLIAAHDRPFTGQISIGPEPLLQIMPGG